MLYLHQPYRTLVLEWKKMARGYLAAFRAARALAADKAAFDRLAEDLSGASEEIRAWWPEVDVESFDEGVRRLRHPTRGLVAYTYVALASEAQSDLKVVAYIPMDADGARCEMIDGEAIDPDQAG